MKLWRSQEGATIELLSVKGLPAGAAKVLKSQSLSRNSGQGTGVTVELRKSTTFVQRLWEPLVALVTEGSVWMWAG